MPRKLTYVKSLIATLIGVLFIFPSMFGVGGSVKASAETNAQERGVVKELGGLTINGNKFNVEDYPADEEGVPQVLYLNEIGYSYYANKQEAYGLTIYLYNPRQIQVVDDARNQVQMLTGGAERYKKYGLKLVDASADRLFYKFAVKFTADEKGALLSALDKESRAYEVSGIELYSEGFNAEEYAIARTYTYTGYGAGLGEAIGGESTLQSTLNYTIAGGTNTIPLKIEHTSWRPAGTNGRTAWTQDTIHSVYFAVPNEHSEEYDYLKSVQAKWLEARLAPTYLTANKALAEDLTELYQYNLSKAVSNANGLSDEELKNTTYGGLSEYTCKEGKSFDWLLRTYEVKDSAFDVGYFDIVFGRDKVYNQWKPNHAGSSINRRLEDLTLFAYTDNPEGYLTSSSVTELIQRRQSEIDEAFPQNTVYPVANKYAAVLFDSWDLDFKTKIIKIGEANETEKDDETIITSDKLNLQSEEVNHSFWQKVFGQVTTSNQESFKGIDAIKVIDPQDVEKKTPTEVSDSYYISERDAINFKNYCKAHKDKATIYIMRFAISEYWRQPTYITKLGEYRENNEGYFAQETAYLDFDILDFEYVKNDKSYIVPVSMSPIDIFSEFTPPPKYDKNDFTPYAFALLGGGTATYIVYCVMTTSIRKRRYM